MKKAVKFFGESLKGNEKSFEMIEFLKLLRDKYGSKDFDHEKELKERIKNQS
jgi:hypothetical protein